MNALIDELLTKDRPAQRDTSDDPLHDLDSALGAKALDLSRYANSRLPNSGAFTPPTASYFLPKVTIVGSEESENNHVQAGEQPAASTLTTNALQPCSGADRHIETTPAEIFHAQQLQERADVEDADYAFAKNASNHWQFWDSPYLSQASVRSRLADVTNPPAAKERRGLEFMQKHFKRFADPDGYIYLNRFRRDIFEELSFLEQ